MQNHAREIVSTYNLPPKIKALVFGIAERNIERLGLSSFDEQYRFVARLVEKFEASYEDRTAVRLDSPIFGDGRTWHDILPARGPYEESEGLTLSEAVGTSHSFLSERQREITYQLIRAVDADGVTELTIDDVIADFLGIKWRSEDVARLVEQDPRFRQPERRLVHVRLDDSPYLQFGRRNYDGDPLGFFRRHIDVYGRFVEEGRWALQRFDNGLYKSLLKYVIEENGTTSRQLDIAIPKIKMAGRREYGEIVQARIIEARSVFGNAHKASRNMPHSAQTFLKYWRRARLEIKRGGPRTLSEEDEKKIVEAHTKYNGSAYQATRNLPFRSQTILRYWRKHSLPILGRGENPAKTLEEEKQQNIVKAYNTYFGNAREAARAFGCSKGAVIKYWRKNGLEPGGHGCHNLYSADLRRRVQDSYEFCSGNAEHASRDLGVSATNIRRIWRRGGLIAVGKGGWPKGVSRQEMKEAV